jgi:hypothetical protein
MQARRHAQGRLPLFDAVATYSSVEHSGLGRCICCVFVIQGRAGARACVRVAGVDVSCPDGGGGMERMGSRMCACLGAAVLVCTLDNPPVCMLSRVLGSFVCMLFRPGDKTCSGSNILKPRCNCDLLLTTDRQY